MRGQPRLWGEPRTAFPFHLPFGRTIALPYTRRRPTPSKAQTALSPLTLVLGGARSGKSRYAEALLAGSKRPPVYIATAEPLDDEMRQRIAAHRAARGASWQTIEAPIALPTALESAGPHPVLVDCLTLWLSNLILADHDPAAATAALDRALDTRAAPTILVSSEVGLGIVPENALARRFRDEAGRLHQHLATRADTVTFLVAGIPVKVK